MESENKTRKRNSVLWKGCFVLLVALVLQIPILMVKGVVNDRKELSNEVESEVSNSWGGILSINSPELIVPYSNLTQKDGKTYKEKLEQKIPSSEITIDSDVDTEILHRSIYDVPVYRADMQDIQYRTFFIDADFEACFHVERNVTNEHTETNRNQQHRFKLLGYRQVDEHQAHENHHQVTNGSVGKTGIGPEVGQVV